MLFDPTLPLLYTISCVTWLNLRLIHNMVKQLMGRLLGEWDWERKLNLRVEGWRGQREKGKDTKLRARKEGNLSKANIRLMQRYAETLVWVVSSNSNQKLERQVLTNFAEVGYKTLMKGYIKSKSLHYEWTFIEPSLSQRHSGDTQSTAGLWDDGVTFRTPHPEGREF